MERALTYKLDDIHNDTSDHELSANAFITSHVAWRPEFIPITCSAELGASTNSREHLSFL